MGLIVLLSACGGPGEAGMAAEAGQARTAAAVAAFLGAPLPDAATDVHAAMDDGIDRLALLRLDLPDADAARYARQLLGGREVTAADPGLGYLGAGRDWWIAAMPAGGRGGETQSGNRTVKLVTAPAAAGRTRLWVAAFSQ